VRLAAVLSTASSVGRRRRPHSLDDHRA
jgi:hypothetical protein